MNNKDILRYLKLLKHDNQTEIRVIKPTPDFKGSKWGKSYFGKSEEYVLKVCEKHNEKENLYAGINERIKQGKNKEDVVSVGVFPIDIDSRNKPATEKDLLETEQVCNRIIEYIGEEPPTKIFSGNGYQLLYSIPKIKITKGNREKIDTQLQNLQRELKHKFDNKLVCLDNVGDLPRIMRIPGTYNLRAKRDSKIIEYHTKPNKELRKRILKQPVESISLHLTEKNEKVVDESRSGQEFGEVCKLINKGLSKEKIYERMNTFKKWSDSDDNYRDITYKKSLESIESDKTLKGKNLELLDSKEIIYHNINQGEHEGCWYYGKLFPYTNKVYEILNEEREGIILSNKGILLNKLKVKKTQGGIKFLGQNEIKKFGLNYIHGLEVNKNFWSNKRIKKFFKGLSNKTPREVFERIREKIKFYMDVPDDRIYDLTACWIIGTYCYELFESFGYLYFQALRDSGKSKFKKILRLIGFNGQEASSITEASFFRTIENTKGVLCIDEYERMDTERKKSTDLLLNAGIEKGATVKRVDVDSKPKRNRDFDVYCPKIICNITGLDPVTQTRCVTIRMSRTATEKGNRKPRTNDKEWQDIRDDCYELIMNQWEKIKGIYQNYKTPLKNRDEDVWLPILVISKFFGEDVEKKVLGYAQTYLEVNQIEIIENDRTYQILRELIDMSTIPEKEEREFHPLQLGNYLKNVLSFGDKNPERVTGWHLSSLNIFKKGRDEKGVTYKLSKYQILLAMVSRGYPIPDKYQKTVKELHKPTITNITTTTTTTTKKKDVVPEVHVVNTGNPMIKKCDSCGCSNPSFLEDDNKWLCKKCYDRMFGGEI